MGKYDALDAAKAYAAKVGLSVAEVLATGHSPSRWLFVKFRWYSLTAHTGNGIAVVNVAWPGCSVERFEFYPTDGKSPMLPLWLAYPTFNSLTIGWRMGSGENYKHRWHQWYRGLTDEQRTGYKDRFPPPQEDSWSGFYEEIAERASQGTITDHISGRVR